MSKDKNPNDKKGKKDKKGEKPTFNIDDLKVNDFDTLPDLEDVSGGGGDCTAASCDDSTCWDSCAESL